MRRLWCGCLRHLLHLLHLCHLLHPCRFWYLLLPQQLPTNAHPSMVKTTLKWCTPHETVWWSYQAVWICILCDFYGFTSQPRRIPRPPWYSSLILHDFSIFFGHLLELLGRQADRAVCLWERQQAINQVLLRTCYKRWSSVDWESAASRKHRLNSSDSKTTTCLYKDLKIMQACKPVAAKPWDCKCFFNSETDHWRYSCHNCKKCKAQSFQRNEVPKNKLNRSVPWIPWY